MSLQSTPIRHEDNDQPFTITDFSGLFVNALGDRPSTEFTIPQQAADFYTGLCALQPMWRNRYLANSGHQGVDSVHIHGEYGYAYVVNMGVENPAAMFISVSWCVGKDEPDLFRNAVGMLRECMRLQLPVDTLVQWFDTMTRFRSGKRTSPHFDPTNSLNKIRHRALPMVQALNERDQKFTEAFKLFLNR